MKKLVAVILCLAMILALAACGQEPSAPPQEPADTEEPAGTEEPVVEAEVWPTEDLTLIMPFKAGGALDTTMLLLCEYWAKHLGVNIRTEYLPGANGQAGTEQYMMGADDDYKLLAIAQPHFSFTIVTQDASYSMDDFAILNMHEADPAALCVGIDSDINTIEELDSLIQSKPGEIRMGTQNVSGAFLETLILEDYYGWDIKTIFYGSGEARTALMGNHIDIAPFCYSGILNNGTEKPLVFAAPERLADYPDIPTLEEVTGEEQPFLGTMRFLAIRQSLKEQYPERYETLVRTLEETYNDPEYQAALEAAGTASIVGWHGPEESTQTYLGFQDLVEIYKDRVSETNQ